MENQAVNRVFHSLILLRPVIVLSGSVLVGSVLFLFMIGQGAQDQKPDCDGDQKGRDDAADAQRPALAGHQHGDQAQHGGNAVEHGRDSSNNGFVSLVIEGGKRAADDLSIIITNQGEPSEEDLRKIRALLEETGDEPEHAGQIGIRNVNRRLKMVYSEASGLTIEPDGHGNTRSTIFVKKSQTQQFKL